LAKKLYNRSRTVQFLKTSVPGGIGGLYQPSLRLNPGEVVIVSDFDFKSMTALPEYIQVLDAVDDVIDSVEEVEQIIADSGGGGGGESGPTPNTLVLRDGVGGFATSAMQVNLLYALSNPDITVNLNIANLTDSAGGNSLDWGTRGAYDSSGQMSLQWDSRTTLDTNNMVSVDWSNRDLLDSAGSESVKFENRHLRAANSSMSVNWGTRELSDGLTGTTLDWAARQAYRSSGATSLDWQSGRLFDAGIVDSVHWINRTLGDGDGNVVADWVNGLRPRHGNSSQRPAGLGLLAYGVQYYDTEIQQLIFWNGTKWVEPLPRSNTFTLNPGGVAALASYPGLTLVSGADLEFNQAIVWETLEFRCNLNSGTPYTTTANFFINIIGNYPGGQRFPAGDTANNGNLGLLTEAGRDNRRMFYRNGADMQIQAGPGNDLLLMLDGPATGGTEPVQIRVTYRVVDML